MPGWGDGDSDACYTQESWSEEEALENADATMLLGSRRSELERAWCCNLLQGCIMGLTRARCILREWRASVVSDSAHAVTEFPPADAALSAAEVHFRSASDAFSVMAEPLGSEQLDVLQPLRDSLAGVRTALESIAFWFPGNVGSACRAQCQAEVVALLPRVVHLEQACAIGHRLEDGPCPEEGEGPCVCSSTVLEDGEATWRKVLLYAHHMVVVSEQLVQWAAPPFGSERTRRTPAHIFLCRCRCLAEKCKLASMGVMHLAGVNHRIPQPWVSDEHMARVSHRCEYVHEAAGDLLSFASRAATSPGGALVRLEDAKRLSSSLLESSQRATEMAAALRR